MIHESIISAQNAISNEEVKSMIKDLSDFNLGVFVPHFRDGKGIVAPQPENLIAHEVGLKISFEDSVATMEDKESVAIGWYWADNQVAGRCSCHQTGCPCNEYGGVIVNALESIKVQKVQDILQKLSKYGLGISVPHFHNPEIVELPFDTVAVEKHLEVTFEKASNKIFEETIPVAWRWNGEQVSTWMVEYLN